MAHDIADLNAVREVQLDGDPGTVGQIPFSGGPGAPCTWGTPAAASGAPAFEALAPTAANTVPAVATAPAAGTAATATFYVNGDQATSAFSMNAAGAITFSAAAAGYNIDASDEVSVSYTV